MKWQGKAEWGSQTSNVSGPKLNTVIFHTSYFMARKEKDHFEVYKDLAQCRVLCNTLIVSMLIISFFFRFIKSFHIRAAVCQWLARECPWFTCRVGNVGHVGRYEKEFVNAVSAFITFIAFLTHIAILPAKSHHMECKQVRADQVMIGDWPFSFVILCSFPALLHAASPVSEDAPIPIATLL